MKSVWLYETNAGGLIIWSEDLNRGYMGLEHLTEESFSDLARTLSLGEEGWNLSRIVEHPEPGPCLDVIAFWDGVDVELYETAGVAGRKMLDREKV